MYKMWWNTEWHSRVIQPLPRTLTQKQLNKPVKRLTMPFGARKEQSKYYFLSFVQNKTLHPTSKFYSKLWMMLLTRPVWPTMENKFLIFLNPPYLLSLPVEDKTPITPSFPHIMVSLIQSRKRNKTMRLSWPIAATPQFWFQIL